MLVFEKKKTMAKTTRERGKTSKNSLILIETNIDNNAKIWKKNEKNKHFLTFLDIYLKIEDLCSEIWNCQIKSIPLT